MKWEFLPIALILVMFGLGAYFYGQLPDIVPVHWDAQGNPDGYGSKFTGTFLLPLIAAGVYLLITFIPYIAVYQRNIKSFHFYLFGFKTIFLLFFLVLHIAGLMAASGRQVNMNLVILPMVAVLLYAMAVLMGKAKRNYFIGIRTPWTLASEKVWDRTHEVGAKWMKVLAVAVLVLGFVPNGVYFMIGLLIAYFSAVLAYSYYVYKQ